jgi:hypothetical protein
MLMRWWLIEKVEKGEKNTTRRRHPSVYRVGRKYILTNGGRFLSSARRRELERQGKLRRVEVLVLSVETEPLGAITEADAAREGFAPIKSGGKVWLTAREQFFAVWATLYGLPINIKELVDVIKFVPTSGPGAKVTEGALELSIKRQKQKEKEAVEA